MARRLQHFGKPEKSYISDLQERIEKVCRGHIKWLEELQKKRQLELEELPEKMQQLLELQQQRRLELEKSQEKMQLLELQKTTRLELEESQERMQLLESRCFAANYWVTGIEMPTDTSDTWQPKDVITDTAFQLLKVADFDTFYNDDMKAEGTTMVRSIWENVRLSWIKELNRLDERKSFAWPHAIDEGIRTFRLDDHFWVWNALKSTDDVWKRRNGPGPTRSEQKTEAKTVKRLPSDVERLTPADAQRVILQRFTTENDVSGKRMLAVARSARETRFLFHSRDTALFHGEDCGFFFDPGSSFYDLWENTIEAQVHHNDSKDTSWDNAIRYALGIMAGARNHRLNKRGAADLMKHCLELLIGSGGHNGFFAGQLDEATKEPIMFDYEEDGEVYYHANFEINHILLTDARRIDAILTTSSRSADQEHPQQRSDKGDAYTGQLLVDLVRTLGGITTQPKRQTRANDPGNDISDIVLKHSGLKQGFDGPRNLTMKKVLPFNSLIDLSSITSFGDEWLYSYPEFLSTKEINLEEEIVLIISHEKPISDNIGGILAQELGDYCDSKSSKPTFPRQETKSSEQWVFIDDTPKQKHVRQAKIAPLVPEPLSTRLIWSWQMDNIEGEDIYSKLGTARTADLAKKRFIWLPQANCDIALICWMASHETEKLALSLFFDRHSRYEKYVWDDTTMVLNVWQTELHLSFYVLADTGSDQGIHSGIPPKSSASFPPSSKEKKRRTSSGIGSSTKEIRRASMGFRFDGDFFDRYWTCHFIEHIPTTTRHNIHEEPIVSRNGPGGKEWRQRKILELLLLNRILATISEGSREILEGVKTELKVDDKAFFSSVINSDTYVSFKNDAEKFEPLLQVLDDDITSIIETLQKWSGREKERGPERPRWTRDDERKYRRAINKAQGSTERHTRELKVIRDKIRKLREAVTKNLEKSRQDTEFLYNQNIQVFTYVTVIFLPLGFAASFYSMSGAPDHDLMVSLVEFAIAAFAVTVVLLYSANELYQKATNLPAVFLQRMREKTKAAKRTSLLVERQQIKEETNSQKRRPEDEENSRHEPNLEGNKNNHAEDMGQESQRRENFHQDLSSPVSFWLAYLFVEIPARKMSRILSHLEKRKMSWTIAAESVLGVFVMLAFGVSWLLSIVGLNIVDFIRLSSEYMIPGPKASSHVILTSIIQNTLD